MPDGHRSVNQSDTPPPPSIWAELARDVTDLDRGVLGTIRDLFVRPRAVLASRLASEHPGYFAPFKLLLIIGGVYALLANWVFDLDAQFAQAEAELQKMAPSQNPTATLLIDFFRQIMRWVRDYQSLLSLVYVPPVAAISEWAFRSRGLGFRAHAYAWAYTYSGYYLITTALVLGVGLAQTLGFSRMVLSDPAINPWIGLGVTALALFVYGVLSGRLLGITGGWARVGLALTALVGSSVAGLLVSTVAAIVFWLTRV